jgi:hypothetical protein
MLPLTPLLLRNESGTVDLSRSNCSSCTAMQQRPLDHRVVASPILHRTSGKDHVRLQRLRHGLAL